MASSTQTDELDAREAEAEQARTRLAATLDKLTSPETHEAIRAEVLGIVQGYKDDLVKHAETYKNELLHKADEYKGEILTQAESYKGELFSRAETYKDEFLDRADRYKDEALQRAQAYKDEALQRARDSSRETVRNVVDDVKLRAMNNPVAVALIAGGVGYRLYKNPPVTTLLVGAGAAMLMRTPGRSGHSDPMAYRDPYDEERPGSYVPGGVAGYGYPVEEDAPGSSTTEQIASTVRETAAQMRDSTREWGSSVSKAAGRARSMVSDAADEAYERGGGLAARVRQNPALLALAALAAGAAIARAVRSTDTGDRLVRQGTGTVRRGVRSVAERVGDAAGQAVETVGGVADTVRTRVPEAVAGMTDAAGRLMSSVGASGSAGQTRGGGQAGARQTRQRRHMRGGETYSTVLARRFSSDIPQIAERYPLLFTSFGLVAGAAAGAMLRPTAVEDRYVGAASDALKHRVQQRVANQVGDVATLAEEVISSAVGSGGSPNERQSRSGTAHGRQPEGAAPTRDDTDPTAVEVERAGNAATAGAAAKGKPPMR